ncbi:hypothetical protein [Actinomadura luteofluorescens]|uniref:hypothetical protein n=1 Tax=Actinomadura luteofluorescens TaxID=46163 RepID=UPI003D8DE3DB
MDPMLLSILITLAIRHAWENGRTEYAHVRDRRAAELAATYPTWSPSRVKRVARKAARRYWWRQIRKGFPEVRDAYSEGKELAEVTRIEAETAGLRRRADIRERIRKALAEAEEIRQREQAHKPGDPAPAAKGEQAKPAGGNPAPQPGAADPADPGQRPAKPTPGPAADPSPAEAPEAPEKPCANCTTRPGRPRRDRTHLCDRCWEDYFKDHFGETPQPGHSAKGATIIPLKPPQAPAPAQPTEGDTMTVPTGEYTGYESAVANWTEIERLSQQLQSHYEQLMAAYKSMNVDDQTITRAGACHEAEENHLVAVQAARSDFVSRHGAVKETKEATGAAGDQALYNS